MLCYGWGSCVDKKEWEDLFKNFSRNFVSRVKKLFLNWITVWRLWYLSTHIFFQDSFFSVTILAMRYIFMWNKNKKPQACCWIRKFRGFLWVLFNRKIKILFLALFFAHGQISKWTRINMELKLPNGTFPHYCESLRDSRVCVWVLSKQINNKQWNIFLLVLL